MTQPPDAPSPTLLYTSRCALEAHAASRATPLRLHLDDGVPVCGVCLEPLSTTGEQAQVILLNTGHVYHRACAARCSLEQRRRELATRGRCRPDDAEHVPKTAYVCEFGRVALTAEEADALGLPAWPADAEGWATDDEDEVVERFDRWRDAVGANDIDAMDALLDDGMDIEGFFVADDDNCHTALTWASSKGHLEAVEYLLQYDIRLDDIADDGKTALTHAAWEGHTAIARALVRAGATVDFTIRRGARALHLAATRGHAPVVRVLLEAGSAVDQPDGGGGTALTRAACSGHTAVVAMLLDAGATVDAADAKGFTAFLMAAMFNHAAVMRQLLDRGAASNATCKDGSTALFIAIVTDSVAAVELLLDLGQSTWRGESALDVARRKGSARGVLEFLKRR